MLSLLNFAQLMSNMAAAVQGSASSLINLAVGSTLRALLEAFASVAMWLQWLIWLVLQQTRAATSTGTALDTWMADYGVTRLAGTQATGYVTVSRFTATTSALVNVGATFITADGTQTFAVVANTMAAYWNGSGYLIPAGTGSASIPVQAVNYGTGGNVNANTITQLGEAIPGIDTVNNTMPFTTGSPAETDAALRTRFQLYINTLSRATLQAIEYCLQNTPGVTGYVIVQNADQNGTYDPGSFYCVVDDGTGAPSSALITAALTSVSVYAGCGIRYSVVGPTIVTATISMAITVSSGATLATVESQVAASITSYVNTLSIGSPLPYSRLSALAYANAYVTNVTSILLNGGTSDLNVSDTQVIKTTSVTVT
jgi:uncharacterized phage protein gp47/JayE